MARATFDPEANTFTVERVGVISLNSPKRDWTDFVFTTYLCGHCSDTHVVFQCVDMDVQFNMAIPAEEAEELANMLLNPKPKKMSA